MNLPPERSVKQISEIVPHCNTDMWDTHMSLVAFRTNQSHAVWSQILYSFWCFAVRLTLISKHAKVLIACQLLQA